MDALGIKGSMSKGEQKRQGRSNPSLSRTFIQTTHLLVLCPIPFNDLVTAFSTSPPGTLVRNLADFAVSGC